MSIEDIRLEIRKRILEKAQVVTGNLLASDVANTLERYKYLSLREKDFVFRYVNEPYRTYQQWAAYYSVSYGTIQNMMLNPEVRACIKDVQSDIRKYALGTRLYLLKEAYAQYLNIFRATNLPDSLETKRKAAQDVLSWFGTESPSDGRELNINIFSGGGSENVTPSTTGVKADLHDIEKAFLELKEISAIAKEVKPSGHIKRSNRGSFHDDVPSGMEVE